MKIGFDTIGNAILICYDQGSPILVTDASITGSAYLGSWSFSHEIPAEQLTAIRNTKYVWLSHGHPDHLGGIDRAASRRLFQGVSPMCAAGFPQVQLREEGRGDLSLARDRGKHRPPPGEERILVV